MQYAFRDRKNKKRSIRSLWIARINAGSRNLGIPYSKLINGMSKNNIIIDRKILSELVVNDEAAFKKVVEIAVS